MVPERNAHFGRHDSSEKGGNSASYERRILQRKTVPDTQGERINGLGVKIGYAAGTAATTLSSNSHSQEFPQPSLRSPRRTAGTPE